MKEQNKSAPASPTGPFGALAWVGQAFVTYVLEDPTAPYSSTQLAATAGALQHAVPPSKHSKLIAQ